MSPRYSIAQARSRLPSLVNQAEAGIDVELTRRGQPVAVLISRREVERLRGKRVHFGDAYKKFIETQSLDGFDPVQAVTNQLYRAHTEFSVNCAEQRSDNDEGTEE